LTIDEARSFALSLAGVSEEPHFERTSFRVAGKIFATAPGDGESLNVFVEEESARAAAAEDPRCYELLYWGKRLVGVRVKLAAADHETVIELLEEAWSRRAPRSRQ
jgi:hypothetical protein